MRHAFAIASLLALSACGFNGTDRYRSADEGAAPTAARATGSPPIGGGTLDPLASHDGRASAGDFPDSEQRPTMQAQVVLDRLGFGPGVIDGKMGQSTVTAIEGFQEANGLPVTGKIDDATKQILARWQSIPATRVVTIPADWAQGEYFAVPKKPEDQAKMQRLGYVSLDERLAERFHTTVETLKALNPGGRPAGAPANAGAASAPATAAPSPPTPTPTPTATDTAAAFAPQPGPKSFFTAGQQVRVPNIGADRIEAGKVEDQGWQRTLASLGVGTVQPKAARIVVSKAGNTLKAYDEAGKLTAIFTVSSGSSHDPLPLGDWKINGKAYNPPFSYNPELFWDVPDSKDKQQLPPGPNGPVGVVWIDLSKEHYGIHGTPEPQLIGRGQSHGCVRLTNWDAARLAQMVNGSTKVEFVP